MAAASSVTTHKTPLFSLSLQEDDDNPLLTLATSALMELTSAASHPETIVDVAAYERRDRDFTVKSVTERLATQLHHAQLALAAEPDGKDYRPCRADDIKIPDITSELLDLNGFDVGVCQSRGRNKHMEDRFIVSSFTFGSSVISFCGVFDGHSGKTVSRYLRDHITEALEQQLAHYNLAKELTTEGIWLSLKTLFVKLHEELPYGIKKGSTAIICLIINDVLWTASVGDSRAILSIEGRPYALSLDAKPDHSVFQSSIQKRGGSILERVGRVARVGGSLATARSVGDSHVKGISRRAKITRYPLSDIPEDTFLIMGSDGLFDLMSSRQIALQVYTGSFCDLDTTARNLVASAYQSGSGDNMTAIVMLLK